MTVRNSSDIGDGAAVCTEDFDEESSNEQSKIWTEKL